MSGGPSARHGALYRKVLLAYPRRFRRQYGRAMEELFVDEIRFGGEPARHVWRRTLGDVVRSAPAERVGAMIDRTSPAERTLLGLLLVAVAVVLAALTGAPGLGMLPLLVAGAGYAIYRPRRRQSDASLRWYRLVGGGVGLFALVFLGALVPWPDSDALGEILYYVVVVTVLTAVALISIGIALGVAAFVRHMRRREAS
jgi:hypothetical protein